MEVIIVHLQKEDCNHILSGILHRAPARISSLFTKHFPLSNLRDNMKLYVQRPKSDFLRSSFSHRASILWNNLPMYLKSKPNVVSFKSALKAKSNILDKITFNGTQGVNKDIVNYIYCYFYHYYYCYFKSIFSTIVN